MLWTTALAGIAGVFCSGMVYHVTHRDCWRGERSLGRFFASGVKLGLAAAWLAARFSGGDAIAPVAALVIATLVSVSRELAWLRSCPDDADLNDEVPSEPLARCAFLMRFRLGSWLRLHFACAWLGGILLPLLSLLPGARDLWLVVSGFVLCLAGEVAGRALFFRAAVPLKMPGGVAA